MKLLNSCSYAALHDGEDCLTSRIYDQLHFHAFPNLLQDVFFLFFSFTYFQATLLAFALLFK